MFELLFKYPASIFHKGQFVFLTPWPIWLLAIAILAAAGALFWHVRRNHGMLSGAAPDRHLAARKRPDRPDPVPALAPGAEHRHAAAPAERGGGSGGRFAQHVDQRCLRHARGGGQSRCSMPACSKALSDRFQVRLYKFGKEPERIQKPDQLTAARPGLAPRRHAGARAGGILVAAARRDRAAERRRGQRRRHRPGDHRGDPPAAHSDPHHRLRQGASRQGRRDHRCRGARARAAAIPS